MTEENIIIGDYLFTGAELSIENSEPYHELVTTKIMNGTSVSRQGEWIPIKFSCTVPYCFDDPVEVTRIVRSLHGTFQEVLCPYVTDDLFNAYIKVGKALVSPEVYELTFDIEQVSNKADNVPVSDVNGFILEETE